MLNDYGFIQWSQLLSKARTYGSPCQTRQALDFRRFFVSRGCRLGHISPGIAREVRPFSCWLFSRFAAGGHLDVTISFLGGNWKNSVWRQGGGGTRSMCHQSQHPPSWFLHESCSALLMWGWRSNGGLDCIAETCAGGGCWEHRA